MAGAALSGHPRLKGGQAISYAEDNGSETRKGVHQIVNAPELAVAKCSTRTGAQMRRMTEASRSMNSAGI